MLHFTKSLAQPQPTFRDKFGKCLMEIIKSRGPLPSEGSEGLRCNLHKAQTNANSMAPVASSSKGQRKPYARPAELSKLSASKTDLGAPSQPGQTSRKGKKAWRKNIDIADIEEGLEQAREEERVTG